MLVVVRQPNLRLINMTNKTDKFDNLIRLLEKELKLTGTEIAETLWLAMRRQYPSSVDKKTSSKKNFLKDLLLHNFKIVFLRKFLKIIPTLKLLLKLILLLLIKVIYP